MKVKSRLLSVVTIFVITLALLFLMLGIFGADTTFAEAAQAPAIKVAANGENSAAATTKQQSGPGIYIVVLQDEPLVAYKGGIQGLAATNPQARGERKLNVDSSDSVAYLDYLAQKRGEALASMNNALGRNVTAIYEYKATLNGVAIELTPAEADIVANLPEVKFLEREMQFELHTDAGPTWIGAPGIWDGSATGGLPGTMGEGIIVGVIDTGIDPWNPSFADVGDDAYDHTNPWGAGIYVGVCDSGDPTYDPTFPCNDKLIGAWGYAGNNGGDPRDSDGHGSHTSSTAAGNFVNDTVISTTTRVFTASISGVAPHANVVMYAACCAGSDLTAARDQVVLDGVDVVNYSIGANVPTDNPWTNSESQQWLNMRDAGIFVATSAGNNGPDDATLFRPGDIPWLTAVAASSHNRTFLNSLTVTESVTNSITLNGESMTGPLSTPAEVVLSSWFTAGGTIDPEDARLCGSASGNPFPPGTFSGEIVVCERGIYGRVEKGENVAAAGAGGYILAQPDEFGGGPGSLASDPHVLPAVHINYYEYQDLLNFMASASTPVMGTIAGSVRDVDIAHADILASFSSRGPNSAPLLPDILKPQIAAPGRAIWAAYHQGAGGDGTYTYNVIQGTSMASPHVAGAGALLMALHPEWTPSMIESAMATTANTAIFNDDGVNQATPFGMGSGRVNLRNAAQAGLVMDVTTAEFQAANPGSGGDPKELNLSSLANSDCLDTCSWTRTVSSTLSVPMTWTASVQAPTGMTLTVSPASFMLPAFGTQVMTITADVLGLTPGQWEFGQVNLIPDAALRGGGIAVPPAHLPVAVIQGAEPASIEIPPDAESTQTADVTVVQPFTITNNGGSDLTWNIFEDASAQAPASLSDGVVNTSPERQMPTAPAEPSKSTSSPASRGGVVADGGFEGGTPNASWNEFSTNFGTPLCDTGCGTGGGTGPHSGSWWAWFGGINDSETGSVDQNVTIPSGSNTLSFWLEIPTADNPGFLNVEIDNNVVFSVTEADGSTYMTYTQVVVDITAYADDGSHNLEFYSEVSAGSNVTNFFVDDVEITSGNVATCDVPDDISWLSVSPTSGTTLSGTSDVVDLTFDSTGLTAGVYTGTLCVSSNDPVNPLVSAPVTLTVLGQAPPDIVVDPASLSANHAPDNVSVQTFDISNVGESDLLWTIDEAEPLVILDVTQSAPAPLIGTSDYELFSSPTRGVETSAALGSQALIQSEGAVTLVLDDGVAENNIGIGGGQWLWLNRFTPAPGEYPFQLEEVHLLFNSGAGVDVDELVDIYVYEDTDSDGDPGTGAVHRGTINDAAVQAVDGTTFSVYTFTTPILLGGPGDVLIAVATRTAGTNAGEFPAALDQTTSQVRSWAGIYGGDPPDPPALPASAGWGTIDSFGFPGNWMIRGLGSLVGCSAPSDLPWLSVSPTAGTTVSNTSSTVDVTFDSTGLAFGTYTGTLCINSNDPDTPLIEMPVTLTVEAPFYGVSIAPDAAMTGTNGTDVTYALEVMNTGNVPDTFDLTVSDNTWMTMLSESSVALGIGESATVSVTMHIPSSVANGAMDTATVTATSQGDGAVTDSATLVTTAVSAGPTPMYLPVFIKN